MDWSSWKTRYRRWRDLPASQRWVLVQAWALFALLPGALRVAGFRRIQAFLTQTKQAPSPPAAAGTSDTVRMVDLAARYSPLRPNCLVRSLTLWWLLRRQGVASELHIGVRKQGDKLEAHAWLEWQGAVLNDQADIASHFSPFDQQMITRSLEIR